MIDADEFADAATRALTAFSAGDDASSRRSSPRWRATTATSWATSCTRTGRTPSASACGAWPSASCGR